MSVGLRVLLFLLAGLSGVCAAAPADDPLAGRAFAAYTFENGRCPFQEKGWFDPARMRCGTVVAMEPGVDEPIRVPAISLKRTDPTSRAAPVVFMNGGPGGRGVTEVGDWLGHPLLRKHDIILYDARGTGQALPQLCPGLGAGILSLIAKDLDAAAELRARTQLVGACLTGIPAPLRGVFATPHMARDIDAIRRMFGYDRVSLYAVSYGTRVAMAYAAEYPQHLDKLLLDSVVPTGAYYQEIGANFALALERAFSGCERSADCDARFPRLREDYRDVLAAIRAEPLRMQLRGGEYAGDTVSLNAQDFALLVQQLFYGDEFIPTFALMIDELKRGNRAPLALLFDVGVGMRVKGLDFATYYLVLGNDELPLHAASQGNHSPGKNDLVFFSQDMALLRSLGIFPTDTPPVVVPRAFPGPLLVIAGSFDPITAPAYGAALADRNRNARYLAFPASGHTASLSDDCARKAATAFLSEGLKGASIACVGALQPTVWATNLYRSPWPRNWLEAIVIPRTTVPMIGFGALLLLYTGLAVGPLVPVAYRALRRRSATRLERSRSDRNTRRLGLGSFVLAIAVVFGLAGLLIQTVTGPAPALLLFGLPMAAYGLLLLALLLVATTLLTAVKLAYALRSRGWRWRQHLWLTAATLTNLALIGFLLRWQVFAPG